jgi:hypothetical protein
MLTPTIKDSTAHHSSLICEKNVEVYAYFSFERRRYQWQAKAREQNLFFNEVYSEPTPVQPFCSHALVNNMNSELNKGFERLLASTFRKNLSPTVCCLALSSNLKKKKTI